MVGQMSLDKAIEFGKEHRKPFRRSKAFDRTCRNHGSCPYCRGNRQHAHRKRLAAAMGDADLTLPVAQLSEATRQR
jgi:hypothetical protein